MTVRRLPIIFAGAILAGAIVLLALMIAGVGVPEERPNAEARPESAPGAPATEAADRLQNETPGEDSKAGDERVVEPAVAPTPERTETATAPPRDFWVPPPTEDPGAAAEPPGEEAGDQPDRPRIELGLKVATYPYSIDGRRRFFAGEPLGVAVRLLNLTAEADYLRHRRGPGRGGGIRGERPAEESKYTTPPKLAVKLPDREYGWTGALVLRVCRFNEETGAKEECLQDLDWRGLLKEPKAYYEAATRLDRFDLRASWNLSPETTGGLRPGRHEIAATFDATWLAGVSVPGGKLTATAAFEVLEPDGGEPLERLGFAFSRTIYALSHKDFDGVIAFARQMIEIEPRYGQCLPYYYLGRGYEGKGMLREAQTAYESYLAIVQDTGMSKVPREVRTRLSRLRQELEKADE